MELKQCGIEGIPNPQTKEERKAVIGAIREGIAKRATMWSEIGNLLKDVNAKAYEEVTGRRNELLRSNIRIMDLQNEADELSYKEALAIFEKIGDYELPPDEFLSRHQTIDLEVVDKLIDYLRTPDCPWPHNCYSLQEMECIAAGESYKTTWKEGLEHEFGISPRNFEKARKTELAKITNEMKNQRHEEDLREHGAVFATDHTSIFEERSALEWLQQSAQRPTPVSLYKNLWIEGEVSCLFADTNVGKSIFAVQIANEIASNRKVLYFDFEMSMKQFERRYTSDDGRSYPFNNNFRRLELHTENLDPEFSLEDIIIRAIEQQALRSKTSVIIIDNLTYLCNDNASGDLAGKLMMRLVELKKKYEWSILVLAHTPKRSLESPLTQNDLAGSKKLINFFDSAFAIGHCASDQSMRYLKQIKCRHAEKEFNDDNVLRLEITRNDGWLHFEERGTCPERAMLKTPDEKNADMLKKQILTLSNNGISTRKIAERLGVSQSKVTRTIRASHDKNIKESEAQANDE